MNPVSAKEVRMKVEMLKGIPAKGVMADVVAKYLEPLANTLELYESYYAQQSVCRFENEEGQEIPR